MHIILVIEEYSFAAENDYGGLYTSFIIHDILLIPFPLTESQLDQVADCYPVRETNADQSEIYAVEFVRDFPENVFRL